MSFYFFFIQLDDKPLSSQDDHQIPIDDSNIIENFIVDSQTNDEKNVTRTPARINTLDQKNRENKTSTTSQIQFTLKNQSNTTKGSGAKILQPTYNRTIHNQNFNTSTNAGNALLHNNVVKLDSKTQYNIASNNASFGAKEKSDVTSWKPIEWNKSTLVNTTKFEQGKA